MAHVAVDFDNTLFECTNYPAIGPEIAGAIKWLTEIALDPFIRVTIFSVRSGDQRQVASMTMALVRAGLPQGALKRLGWSNVKESSMTVFVDDRNFGWQGNFPTKEEIKNFRPYKRHNA